MWQETREMQRRRDSLSAPRVGKRGAWPPGWGLCCFSALAFSFPTHQGKTGFLKSRVSCSFHFREQDIITISFSFDQKPQRKITWSKILLQRVLWFLLWLSLRLESFHLKSFWFGSQISALGTSSTHTSTHEEMSSPFPESHGLWFCLYYTDHGAQAQTMVWLRSAQLIDLLFVPYISPLII